METASFFDGVFNNYIVFTENPDYEIFTVILPEQDCDLYIWFLES